MSEIVHFTEDPKIIALLTEAMREADIQFETTGGGTRNFVRECLLHQLDKVGLTISIHNTDNNNNH
jgi:hypothetical protein